MNMTLFIIYNENYTLTLSAETRGGGLFGGESRLFFDLLGLEIFFGDRDLLDTGDLGRFIEVFERDWELEMELEGSLL